MRRIPVVDDDPHICLAIRAWLTRYGFKVAIADGGPKGSPRCRQFELRPDDRRYLHAQYARFRNDPGAIAIFGYAFSSLEGASLDFPRMALRLGATRCLRKPFRPTTLLSVIDEYRSEAEPHRRYVTTLTAVTDALSEKSSDEPREDGFAD